MYITCEISWKQWQKLIVHLSSKSKEQTMTIPGFRVTSRHHKIPLNSRCHFFFTPEMDLALSHISQVSNFWLSSHNFGEVAIIRKCKYFQN